MHGAEMLCNNRSFPIDSFRLYKDIDQFLQIGKVFLVHVGGTCGPLTLHIGGSILSDCHCFIFTVSLLSCFVKQKIIQLRSQ